MRRLILLSVLTFVPLSVSAHTDSPSFEVQSGPYLIDIGYDRTGIRPGEEVTFDFDLYQEVNGIPSFAEFELIRVEIAQGEEVVHAEELTNEESFVPMMRYAFPATGDYQLAVAYVQSGSVIADASFDVPVGERNGALGRSMTILTYIAAAVLIAAGVWVVMTSFLRRNRPV